MQLMRSSELEALVARRTLELERAQRVKDQLIATVSHEFRTGLSAIGGYAQLLDMGIRGELNPAQREDVRRIHVAYEHLSTIVGDLLSYSRLAGGHFVIESGDVLVADVVAGLGDFVAPRAEAKRLRVEIARPDASMVAIGDGERVKQVLVNLVGNAVKFTPLGGQVAVDCHPHDTTIEIAVSDTGVGIPHDQLESVFEPFVRLRNTLMEPGTGLGLSISRDLARAMGGDVTATSAPGRGSRFVLTLQRSIRSNSAEEQKVD